MNNGRNGRWRSSLPRRFRDRPALSDTIKILGRFPDELSEEFSRNPRYLGYKFPDLSKPETLEKRYIGKLSKKALSLISGLLELLPENRLTAVQALSHPFFDGIRDPETETYLANLKKTVKKVTTKVSTKITNPKEKSVKRNNVKYVRQYYILIIRTSIK